MVQDGGLIQIPFATRDASLRRIGTQQPFGAIVLEGLFCFGPRRDSGLDRWQTNKQNISVQRLQDSLEAACFTV